jgi:hypothetical protein
MVEGKLIKGLTRIKFDENTVEDYLKDCDKVIYAIGF